MHLNPKPLSMPHYTYTAVDAATGRARTGELAGADEESVVGGLKARGLHPIALAPCADPEDAAAGPTPAVAGQVLPGGTFRRWLRPAGNRELTIFTRQLAALVDAGVPLVRSLDLLARQERNPTWRGVIAGLAETIRAGGTLSDGMSRHPRVFDRLFLGMIRAGESGGTLEVVLERLARHLEKAGKVQARMKAAMAYPVVIMVAAVAIVAALLTLVVPRFEGVFAGMLKGAPLPVLTQRRARHQPLGRTTRADDPRSRGAGRGGFPRPAPHGRRCAASPTGSASGCR